VSQAPKYLQQLNDTAPYWAGSTTSPTWWTSSPPKPLAVPRYRLFPRHRRPRVGLLGDAILARAGG